MTCQGVPVTWLSVCLVALMGRPVIAVYNCFVYNSSSGFNDAWQFVVRLCKPAF